MLKLTWVGGKMPPKEMEIRQVYGVVFSRDGRVLLRLERKESGDEYSLAGGTPEIFDEGLEATLRREMLEEVNVKLEDELVLVGYQMVEGDGERPTYAQLRLTGKISEIGEKQPDPDTGRTYERLLISPKRAIELLGWGEIGEKIICEAVEIAKTRWGLDFSSADEEYV